MKKRTAAILTASGLIALTLTACGQERHSLEQPSLERQSSEQKPGEEILQAIAEPVYPTEPDRENFDAWEKFREENEVEETFLETVNDFAFKTALPLLKGRDENAVYSPTSLYYALSLASCGTSGETAKELNAYLGTENSETAAEQAGRLYRWLFKDNDISKTTIATSIWQSQKLHMKPAFLETAANNYYASVFSVDFGDPETAQQMGQWVKEQTRGTISPDIKTNAEQVMHLMNTIYFYDQWTDQFERSQTKTDSFHLTGGGTVEAEFMNAQFGAHGYTKGDGFTRSYLGLKSNSTMVFVLPDEGISLESLLESEERLKAVLEGGEDGMGDVTFKIPKFNLDSHFDIKSMMEQAGIRTLFSDGDFSNMAEEDDIFISSITQDGHIAINEDGVEASAFTDIAYAGAALPDGRAEMILDRPFLYGIKNRGVWLFIGVCDNPAAVSPAKD